MALQIRRGTDAQRQALSGVNLPATGEPLFTTDTRKLFIGDGTTAGGVSLGYYGNIEVSGQGTLSAANNTDVLTLVAGTNIDITTDPTTDTVTINAAATFTELQNESIRIFQNNIVGLNSNEDIVVNPSGSGKLDVVGNLSVSGTITGNLTGNVTGNLNGIASSVTSQANSATTTASSTNTADHIVLRDASGNFSAGTISATAIQTDGITIGVGGNINGQGSTIGNFSTISATTFNGAFDGDVTGSIFSDDNTLMVDAVNRIFIGNVTGNVTGNLFTQDLSIIENRIQSLNSNQSIFLDPAGTGVVNVTSNLLTSGIQIFGPGAGGASGDGTILIITQSDTALPLNIVEIHNTGSTVTGGVNLGRARGSLGGQSAVQNNDTIKQLLFTGYDGTTYRASSAITATVAGAVSSNLVPGKLDLSTSDDSGNLISRLSVASTAITSTVPVKLAVYADATARDAAVTDPTAGMMIFLTAGTKFQGYTGSAWVDLN